MRQSTFILKVVFLLGLAISTQGCALLTGIPPEAYTTAENNAKYADAFVTMMDAGGTSREQEQNFIRANRRAWHAQNYALNDVPLPRDVEIWFKREQLGMQNSAATPSTPKKRSPK